jgi:hypothetical protein
MRQHGARRQRAGDDARRVSSGRRSRCRARWPRSRSIWSGTASERYGTEHGTDGLPGSEGAFLACSFWLADNYAFGGRLGDAEALFERLLGLRNHLGLLSEEYEPTLQRQIGNFPQAFSHLALILTAQIIESVSQNRMDALHRASARGGEAFERVAAARAQCGKEHGSSIRGDS